MIHCVFSSDAEQDLVELYRYMANVDLLAAERMRARIHDLCDMLTQQPQMGRDRSLLAPGLRSIVVSPYITLYRPAPKHVEIVRVLHGRRDIRRLMLEAGR